MSVDDRLRDAFATTPPPEGTLVDSLNAVHTRARRESLHRWVPGAAAVAAAAVAVLVFVLIGGNESRDVAPVEEPTSPAPTSVGAEDSVTELHEWWRTTELTAKDLRQTLGDAGMSQWSDEVIDDLPSGRWTLTLSIQGTGFWTLTANRGDTDEVIDRETVTADGRRLVISPEFADGQSTYDYSIRTKPSGQRVLRLVFVDTTEGDEAGIPGEAFQRALYTTAAFQEFEN